MTLRRLTAIVTAIAGLAFAVPTSAQGVLPAATTGDAATEAAVTAFARAFFEDDNAGMLAELPTMIAATRAEGDTGTTAILEAIRDAVSFGSLDDKRMAFEAFARLSSYGIAKRVYDGLLDFALTLGPTEGFTLWIRTGVVRTAELESLDWFAIDGVSVLSHRSTPPAFAAGLDFNGTNIGGLPGLWVRGVL